MGLPGKEGHMAWIRELRLEWLARRRGAKHVSADIRKAARDIIGPTGWQWSPSWDLLEKKGDAYVRSFDPRVPRSIHISHRDRMLANMPVPLVERCIEDWGKTDSVDKDSDDQHETAES